jgi:hypothetical protein
VTTLHNRLTAKKEADMVKLADMVSLFCRHKHATRQKSRLGIEDPGLKKLVADLELDLCEECSRLLRHGMIRLLMCEQDPKPMCKHCLVQCYAPIYKAQINEVMRSVSRGLFQTGSG